MACKHIFLTGSPGVGKTTLVKKVIKYFEDKSTVSISGFYTEELRENRTRIGFDCVGVNKVRGTLARIDGYTTLPQKRLPRVGRYTVMLNDFETIVIPLISEKSGLVIIDEIGKMELFSTKFRNQVSKLFQSNNVVIFGTIPVNRNIPYVEAIRKKTDVKILNVTFENRNDINMINDIVETINFCLEQAIVK